MDKHGVSFNHIESHVINNASQTSQLYQRGLHYCSIKEEQSQADQNKSSRDNNVNSLSENNRSENHMLLSNAILGVYMPPSQQVLERLNVHSNEGADPHVQPSMTKYDPLDVFPLPSSQQYYKPPLCKPSSFSPPVKLPTSFRGQSDSYAYRLGPNHRFLVKSGSLCTSKGPLSTDGYQGVARIPLASVKSNRFPHEGVRRVAGGTAPSPDQSSSVMSCFGTDLPDTVFVDSRHTFSDELNLKRFGRLAEINQNLYNKEFPSVPVENHVLPPSTCQNFYSEQRKASDTVPNAYSDNLVTMFNEDILTNNVVVPGFERQREAFEQLDKSSTAEFQHLNKKRQCSFERQASVLPVTPSNDVQYAPSESLAKINQNLYNKEFPSVPVKNHVLPPSTCQNFYLEQRKASDTVPNAYYDNLVTMSNEEILTNNVVVPGFERQLETFVQLNKSSTAEFQQMNKKRLRNFERQASVLPVTLSNGVQYAPSESLAKINQNLYNKKFPSVPVENHVLPPSTCQNFYSEQRKASDTVPNAYSDNLVTMSNEDILTNNVVVPGFKRQREAFVQLDKSSTAEFQHLNKKLQCIFERQASALPVNLSNGVQYAPSECSAPISQPALVSRSGSNLSLSSVLICYAKLKIENSRTSQASFLNNLHSVLCTQGKCDCDQYLNAISHFDICRSWECTLCSSARKSFVKRKSTCGSRKLENNKLSHPSSHYIEDSRPFKHAKIGNPLSFRKEACHVGPSGNESHAAGHVINMQKETEKLQEVHVIVERPDCVRSPVASSAVMINDTTGIIETPDAHAIYTHPEAVIVERPDCVKSPVASCAVMINNATGIIETPAICTNPAVVILERQDCARSPRSPVASSAVMINNRTGVIETPDAHAICTNPEVVIAERPDCVRSSVASSAVMMNNTTGIIETPDYHAICTHPDVLSDCSKVEEKVGDPCSNIRNDVADNCLIVRSGIVTDKILDMTNKSWDAASASIHETENLGSNILSVTNPVSLSAPAEALVVSLREEDKQVTVMPNLTEHAENCELVLPDSDQEFKSMEPKTLGVSLIDFFTAKQIKEHLSSLIQVVDQKAKKDMDQSTMSSALAAKVCSLCAMNRLVFASAPLYCSSCSARIKPSSFYYWGTDQTETKHWFCTGCFKGSRGDNITFHGITISKAKLLKTKNTQEDEESWVQCNKCQVWQHQICALYNAKRDCGGKATYICPRCLLRRMEMGEHEPLPKTAACEAKDLPTTMLSDYIEHRLFRRLKQEREDRARAQQKNVNEVLGAEDLVVRVVLSVNKLVKVNQQFLDIFNGRNYPTEFPYKLKVILLFQKIEGVDVCLFGMYVQEFGSECGVPNNRCVYISYLDSIKYFRPDIKTVSGEALRTLVYHEILTSYMDYCKKRGFATGYIWACPPVKGEDYILYCHPEAQKTPKSDKLRNWYKSMLRKATEENIVVQCTNMYDHFFVLKREQNVKITVARLPYFDGDYWSGAAANIFKSFGKGNGGSSCNKVKKAPSKRIFKSMGHTNPSDDSTKDILVMQQLGQTILPAKEDFIVVSLQLTCTNCNGAILHGKGWSCRQCKTFHLCVKCHDDMPNLKERGRHTTSSGEKHMIYEVAVDYMSADTEDNDVTIDNHYFENRHSFLSFCQVNHYQFDTLRRAKHSTMMILYNLHCLDTTTNCSICNIGITAAANGWHCDTCPKVNVCDLCYQQKGDRCHVHKLSGRKSSSNHCLEHKQLLQKKQSVEKAALDLMLHVSKCKPKKNGNGASCSYPNCPKVRQLFRHTSTCSMQAPGGCNHCKKAGSLIILHSLNCTNMACVIPHCLTIRKQKQMMVMHSERGDIE